MKCLISLRIIRKSSSRVEGVCVCVCVCVGGWGAGNSPKSLVTPFTTSYIKETKLWNFSNLHSQTHLLGHLLSYCLPCPSQCCFARWHRHIGRGNGSNENHNVALETCPDKLCLGDLAEMFLHSNFITQLKILESWWNAISLRDQNDVEWRKPWEL